MVRKAYPNAVARTARERLARTLLVRRVLRRVPPLRNELFRVLPVIGIKIRRELRDVDDSLVRVSSVSSISARIHTPPGTN
jgi:hypothetical protein